MEAEVFAAEFIYPEKEFAQDVESLGISTWDIDDVVRFKRELLPSEGQLHLHQAAWQNAARVGGPIRRRQIPKKRRRTLRHTFL
jgi:hypothetical protein